VAPNFLKKWSKGPIFNAEKFGLQTKIFMTGPAVDTPLVHSILLVASYSNLVVEGILLNNFSLFHDIKTYLAACSGTFAI